jgi:hypothetical protein
MPSAGQDGSITVCLNEPYVLWNGLSGNIDMTGTWYNSSNQALGGAQDTSGTIAGQFNYDYIVSNAYCPGDSSTVLVIVDGSCDFTANVDELANSWSVYPNPADKLINISTTLDGMSGLDLLDLQGKHVKSFDGFIQSTTINVEDLPAGLYLIKLFNNNIELTVRISIQ